MFKAWEQRKAKKRYKEFEAWLDDILASGQLTDEVAAVNFNIYDGPTGTYDVELIGAPAFYENDDDWACDELYTSELLSMPAIVSDEDWEKGLLDIIGMVRQYMSAGAYRGLLEGYEAVGVGHVNGDIVVVYRGVAPAQQQPQSEPGVFPVLQQEPAFAPLPENSFIPPAGEASVFVPQQLVSIFPSGGESSIFAPQPEVENFPPEPQAPILPPVPVTAKIELIAESGPGEEPFRPVPVNTPAETSASPPVLVTSAAPPPAECFKLLRELRPQRISCKPKEDYGIRQYELLRAVPYTRWNPAFTFTYQGAKGRIATDLLNNTMGWLLVSQKLKQLLESIENQIEYFPVNVEEEESSEALPGYFVANLLRQQDALSLDDCDVSVTQHPIFGQYTTVKRHALRADALDGANIFKLSQRQEIPVFVTDKFKNLMEDNAVTGITYFPVKLV